MPTPPAPQDPWQPTALANAPDHYRQRDTTDLYAKLIATFGFEAWAQHAEMECIQYLWRCRQKRHYVEDIRKVMVICQRILDEYPKGPRGTTP